MTAKDEPEDQVDARLLQAMCMRREPQAGQAWVELRDRYWRRFHQLFRKSRKNTQDLEDLRQDAFIKIYENACQYHGPKAPYSWLMTIAHNTLMDLFRREKRQLDRPGSDESDDEIFDRHPDPAWDSSLLERRDFGNWCLNILGWISLDYLEVVNLNFLGLEPEEIAEAIKKRTGNARQYHSECIARLRRIAQMLDAGMSPNQILAEFRAEKSRGRKRA